MIIGIDASRYDVKEKTGVELYSTKIINELIEIAKKAKTARLFFYTTSRLPRRFGEVMTLKDFRKSDALIGQRVMRRKRLWTQVYLALEMLRNSVDLLFVPAHTLPIFMPKRAVVMIHDTAFVFFRKAYSSFQYYYLWWSTRWACKRAFRILVPSEATKQDLVSLFSCKSQKIVVIPHGSPNDPVIEVTDQEKREILARFGLKEDDAYFLFVGRIELKKNLEQLISAFNEFIKVERRDFRLILAGKRGIGFKKIWNKVRRLGLEESVLLTGYINEVEKMVLMRQAQAFLFVSVYEGFGLPILEAFQANIPVIISKTAALVEVAGNAALAANPNDTGEICRAMMKIVNEEGLRRALVQKGRARLREFDWKRSASITWKVLIDSTK